MRIVVEIQDGAVINIDADQPLDSEIEFVVMTDNLRDAKPQDIGRADGKEALIYLWGAPKVVDDRRYWRDIADGVRKSEKAYYRSFPDDTSGAIEGSAVEVVPQDRRIG